MPCHSEADGVVGRGVGVAVNVGVAVCGIGVDVGGIGVAVGNGVNVAVGSGVAVDGTDVGVGVAQAIKPSKLMTIKNNLSNNWRFIFSSFRADPKDRLRENLRVSPCRWSDF